MKHGLKQKEIMNKIVELANNIRLKRGWTIQKLADEICMSTKTLWRGINGVGKMSDWNTYKINEWIEKQIK